VRASWDFTLLALGQAPRGRSLEPIVIVTVWLGGLNRSTQHFILKERWSVL
jgi:hypothetical protein